MDDPPSPKSPPADKDHNTTQSLATLADRTAIPTITSTAADTGEADKTTFVPPWRRPTEPSRPSASNARRQSVQFVPNAKSAGSRSSSANRAGSRRAYSTNPTQPRRLSSPPPPAQFRPSVSFDTFANPQASEFSLTLNRKHKDYEYTKRSRTFLCGTDTNEYSDTALEWLIDELVDDGDEVVCLRVVEKDSREAAKWAGGQGEKGYHDEALRFLQGIVKKNTEDKAISVVLEFAIGKVFDTIQQMIRIYEPAILVVGTRGRSLTGYQGLLSSGSVSKYCLQYSPVPVVVVRPSSKRESKKRKRLQDPSRTGYRDILDKSDDAPRGRGTHLLDQNNRYSITGADLGPLGHLTGAGDPDEEARRVAEAIGYSRSRAFSSSRNSERANSLSRLSLGRDGSNEMLVSPYERVLKSPDLRGVDSPDISDDEEEDQKDQNQAFAQEALRPADEAAKLAYERAMNVQEEVDEEAEAQKQREAEKAARKAKSSSKTRSASRGRNDEGSGAAVLGLLAQLDRGIS